MSMDGPVVGGMRSMPCMNLMQAFSLATLKGGNSLQTKPLLVDCGQMALTET